MTQPYHNWNKNQDATVWVGNLDSQANEELLFELFINAGPVVNVNMPRDKVTNTHQGYAFIEFETPEDAEYCIKVFNGLKLFGKPMRVNMAAKDSAQDRQQQEYWANLFVGNLDKEVDEKLLYDTFSRFGPVISAKIMTDPETGQSKGFGFVTFDTFEAADLAIETMNGQFLCNRPIHVSYAFKKDGTKGERHGSAEERLLAKKAQANRPKMLQMPPMLTVASVAPVAPAAAPAAAPMAAPFMAPPGLNVYGAPGYPMAPPPLPQMPPPLPMGYGAPGFPPVPPVPPPPPSQPPVPPPPPPMPAH